MEYIEKAATASPEEAQYSYVYGIGLNSQGKPEEAISFLEAALMNHPYNRDILYTLTTINLEQQHMDAARQYAGKLVEYYPEDENYRQVKAYIDNL
jgi:tetratricopeptide (TPR) repeat protein